MAFKDDVDPSHALADICQRTLRQTGPAIRDGDRWIDWPDVARHAAELTETLLQAGVPPEAAVAFAPRNRPTALSAFLALMAARRRVTMVYPFQSGAALAASIRALPVSAVIMDRDDFFSELIEILDAKGVAGIALADDGCTCICPARTASASASAIPALEILTSGTTGPPKHFPIGYDVVLDYIRQAEQRGGAERPPTLLCFPMSNISGLYTLATSFLRGRSVILLERFTVADWRNYVVEFRPQASGGPPAALAMILADDVPQGDLSSLRYFSTGAAPVDPQVQKTFEDRYGIPVLQTYGATEFGGPVSAMTLPLREAYGAGKSGSVGRPIGGAKLRIRDEDSGMLAPSGAPGTVEVLCPRMGGGWIVTSDLGTIDADGFLYLHGRSDGAIMRGGFKIMPETVEEALRTHPAVADVSVVGIDDRRLLQLPAAAVVLKPGLEPPSPAELEAHIRRTLPATHVPAAWRFVANLPRTVSFKTDRSAVRDLFAGPSASLHR